MFEGWPDEPLRFGDVVEWGVGVRWMILAATDSIGTYLAAWMMPMEEDDSLRYQLGAIFQIGVRLDELGDPRSTLKVIRRED